MALDDVWLTTPISWEFLRDCIEKDNLHLLGRDEEGIRKYKKFAVETLKEFASIGDFICFKVFGYKLTMNDQHKKAVVWPQQRGSRRVFLPNDFPYYFEPSIEHHVLWSEDNNLDENTVLEFVNTHRNGYECLYFINPTRLQSIKSVAHAHILSRPRSIEPQTR